MSDIFELAQSNLTAYAQVMWKDYMTPEHVLKLNAYLEKVESGEITRLLVSMPPRHSKSMNVAQYFPAWFLGRNPDKDVIYSSYAQDQATKFGRLVRSQFSEPSFIKMFPNVHITPESKARDRFIMTDKGSYYAVGRGGPITGKGADLFILDDMYKDNKEAESKLVRKGVIDWYKAVASTRLQKGAKVVMCGTRWNEDDLIGWAQKSLKDQGWVVLNFPAINAKDEALWPEMFPREKLEEVKRTLGPYFWNALYMGRPSSPEGNIFKRKSWQFYTELPPKFDTVIQSWDATFKKTEAGSYVVGQVWGKIGPRYYLIDQVRLRMGFTKTVESIMMVSRNYPESYEKLIEDMANGPAIIEVLQDKIEGIIPIRPDGGKEARANAMSYIQESGQIYLPKPEIRSWVEDYIEEHAAFPNADRDDQVDATTQAINYMRSEGNPMERLQDMLNF